MNEPDPTQENLSSVELVERWRDGDEEAAGIIYSRYIQRMMRVVGGKIPDSMRARVHPEDVVQSVFRTVFRRMQNGEFTFSDDDDLWKLLVTVALNKARKQTTKNLAARRSINRETQLSELTVDESLLQHLSGQPNISDVVAFRETLDGVLAQLDETGANIVQLRLEGFTQDEIAARLGITDRTVRRKLTTIRDIVLQWVTDDSNPG